MLKLVSDDVPNIEQFMSRYRVSTILLLTPFLGHLIHITHLPKMDHPAALHRLKVGVPATVEHSSEAGPETGKWVAETTQVSPRFIVSDTLC
jgi:ESCRT-I complex subunit VPS28